MADNGISNVISKATTGAVSQTRGASGRAQAASGQGGVQGDGARFKSNPLLPQQIINLDGKSFDLNAPRGTYLNIVV